MIELTRGCDVGHFQWRTVPGVGPITELTLSALVLPSTND